jgi:hypothetical protein
LSKAQPLNLTSPIHEAAMLTADPLRPGWIVLVLTTATVFGGCDRAEDRSSGFATRDSAGVTIAENGEVDPATVARWSVDSVPTRTIGVAMGDSAYEFNNLGSVQRLPNGMILVLNGQGEAAFEFRFYDSTGKHVATHGRRGQGPGEHRWINFVGSVGGDTVVGVDFPNSRLSWVSASAGFLRSSRLDENGFRRVLGDTTSGIVETLVPFGDSLYAAKAFRPVPGDNDPFRRTTSFHIVDLARGAAFDVARYDDMPMRQIQLRGRPTPVRPRDAGELVHVVDRTRRRMCAGITTTAELSCVDRDAKRLIIRWPGDPLPYTDADNAEFERNFRAMRTGSRVTPGDIETLLGAMGRPERHPAFNVLQLDTEGNFWLLEYSLDGSNRRRSRFRILDPNGRQIAFADSFPTPRVGFGYGIHIGDRSILRVLRDADGVSTIGVFPIRKPE